jgi:uncharacterized membrane protein
LADTSQNKEDDSSSIIPQDRYPTRNYQSPLPHPQDLKEYNSIIPEGAKRIWEAFEKESEHRRDLEVKESQHKMNLEIKESQHKIDLDKGEQAKSWTGLVLASLLSVGVFTASFVLITTGHDAAGTALATTLAALVGIFVYNSKK